MTEAPPAPGRREENNATAPWGTLKDGPLKEYPSEEDTSEGDPSEEDPSEGDPSEEDPSEGDLSEASPFEENPPEDDLGDTGALPSKYQPDDSTEDNNSGGPRAKGRFAVRRWPAGSGRGPHAGPVEDALFREG